MIEQFGHRKIGTSHFPPKFPIFQGSYPLFATLPPFRNTFSESLGVAKRGTSGVYCVKSQGHLAKNLANFELAKLIYDLDQVSAT